MSRNRMLTGVAVMAAAALGASVAVPALAQTVTLDKGLTLNGQGSSFMSNFVEQCKADSKNEFGINLSYQPTGSGAGRTGFINGTVDFAGSDVPFSNGELSQIKQKFVYIPITIGGVAIVYRLPNVADLTLSAPTLAKIFSGQTVKWNDGDIAKENPGVALPDQVIRVVVRSDSSGTSNVFTDYLSSAGRGNWKAGVQNTFPVPSGNGIAQRGSDGVTNYLASDQGNFGITYAEVSFAKERKLSVAKVLNTAGTASSPEPANVTEAMSAAAVNDDGTLLLNFNAPGAKAYPISTTAYLIAGEVMDKAKGDVLRTFLTYSLGACQAKIEPLGYAPLPTNLVDLGNKAVARINPGSGPVPTIPAKATAATTPATTAPVTSAVATTAPVTTKATATTTKTTKKATKTTKKKSTKTTKK